MPLEREQLLEIPPYGPAHQLPVLPPPEAWVQSVQGLAGIGEHPCPRQTVRFRDAAAVDLQLRELSLLLGLIALLFSASPLRHGPIALLSDADIGEHSQAGKSDQDDDSNSYGQAILARSSRQETQCGGFLGVRQVAG